METTILAIAAVLLLAVQAHRNYLMVQARNNVTQPQPVKVELILPEEYWPTVTVMQEAQELEALPFEFDYEKLAEALSRQPAPNIIVQPSQPTVIPNPTPAYPSGPWWQGPVSEVSISEEHINGVAVRRFPGKVHVQEID